MCVHIVLRTLGVVDFAARAPGGYLHRVMTQRFRKLKYPGLRGALWVPPVGSLRKVEDPVKLQVRDEGARRDGVSRAAKVYTITEWAVVVAVHVGGLDLETGLILLGGILEVVRRVGGKGGPMFERTRYVVLRHYERGRRAGEALQSHDGG